VIRGSCKNHNEEDILSYFFSDQPIGFWHNGRFHPLWGHHVHDDAHILLSPPIDELEMILTRHEDSTPNQIAIYIISSLEGEPIEQLSLRVAHDEWKLGQGRK
jgi:uncharacterized membrane protein YgcG